ncbi:MAG: hypothetical protein P1P86_07435 [Bacteroidales bacterium]|nr:hypothetical protein [Bacteroidales bacterium]
MRKINLKARYPQNYILRQPLWGTLILFFFLSVFMVLYQPFNAMESRWFNFRSSMLVYAFTVSLTALLLILLLKKTRFFGQKKHWTLARELFFIFLVLLGMGITLFLLGFVLEDHSEMSRWNLQTFLDSCK